MILVTGAAGKTSKAIVKARANRGTRVRALVRRPRQIAAFKSLGAAEVSVGGFDEANALSSAVTGAQAIYHICPMSAATKCALRGPSRQRRRRMA
jgi:NAD(P)H dehydrogenase (quinone)